MPIYEFACPKCRVIYSFLSKRINPSHAPTCPKCGHKKLAKQMSGFSMTRGLAEKSDATGSSDEAPTDMPEMDDPRIERAMSEMERDLPHLDENNPKHLAHLMRKMQNIMPPGTMPKEMESAIKRLEAGEDPEKIEEDMGPLLGDVLGGDEGMGEGFGGGAPAYRRDQQLYDY